jgi:hypothetical protein
MWARAAPGGRIEPGTILRHGASFARQPRPVRRHVDQSHVRAAELSERRHHSHIVDVCNPGVLDQRVLRG